MKTLLSVSATIFCLALPLAQPATAVEMLPAGAPSSFASMAENVLPTVVNISTTQKIAQEPMGPMGPSPEFPEFPPGSPFQDFFDDFFQQQMPRGEYAPMPRPQSLGSGFIINSEEGLIVTNSHVVAQAEEIKVILHDDTTLDAEIVGQDDKTDLAILKVETDHPLKAAQWGKSENMKVGDWILAVGNPFGLGGTVTAGIISARQRNINAGPYDDFIQTDASINRGNSGGPMFNLDGEVIGINTAIYSPSGGSVGIGFAIPSDLAKSVIDQLVTYGETRRGWLGVRIQSVTEEIAESLGLDEPKGALIASVTPGGPAEDANLKAGDIILEFNNRDVSEMRRLPRIVAETPIGETVPITIWRQGEKLSKDVTVDQLEKAEKEGLLAQGQSGQKEKVTAEAEFDDLGLAVAPLTDSLRKSYGIGQDVTGLVVTQVERDSDAATKGVMTGDVIQEVNQEMVQSVTSFKEAIANAKRQDKSSVLLLVNSRGDLRFVAVKFNEKE